VAVVPCQAHALGRCRLAVDNFCQSPGESVASRPRPAIAQEARCSCAIAIALLTLALFYSRTVTEPQIHRGCCGSLFKLASHPPSLIVRCSAAPAAAMDVVLEVADTFMFDALYAAILPSQSSSLAGNATFSSLKEQPTAYTAPTTWQYEPSTKYFALEPSQAAYQSQWPRDDWRRQLLSLYLMTWCAPVFDSVIPPFANSTRTGCLVSLYTTFSPRCPTTSSSTRVPSTIPDTSNTRSVSR
jgi:hypothetical protein